MPSPRGSAEGVREWASYRRFQGCHRWGKESVRLDNIKNEDQAKPKITKVDEKL